MAEKKRVLKKVVTIQLDNPEGLNAVDDDENAKVLVENWPEDGKDNIIPVGKPVRVSPHLAMRLIQAGRITSATIQTIVEEE